jgi:tetratricopeptide (TPR) repeat protein
LYKGEGVMFPGSKLLSVICILMLVACSGLLIGSGAKYEFEKGLALFNQGNYEAAVPRFQKATELEPEYTKAYLYLGRSFLNLARWFEALPPLRTAYSLSPSDTRNEMVYVLIDALLGAAASGLKKGDFSSSINLLKEAIEIEPESGVVKNELVKAVISYGGRLLSEGNTREAVSQFSEAVKLAPENIDAYIGLARSFMKDGNFIEAMRTIGKAMQKVPSIMDRTTLEEILKQ